MGGDGGTLNNSRAEHFALRRSVQPTPDSSRTHQRSRASVTECALTGTALRAGETVVDRVGQLYLKESLLEYMLRREAAHVDRLPHIRKFSRDVAAVRWTEDKPGLFICAVTRSAVNADGAFSVGWKCGCVTAPVDVRGNHCRPQDAEECASCGEKGDRVEIGQSVSQRTEAIAEIVRLRRAAKKGRKRAGSAVATGSIEKPKKSRRPIAHLGGADGGATT